MRTNKKRRARLFLFSSFFPRGIGHISHPILTLPGRRPHTHTHTDCRARPTSAEPALIFHHVSTGPPGGSGGAWGAEREPHGIQTFILKGLGCLGTSSKVGNKQNYILQHKKNIVFFLGKKCSSVSSFVDVSR